MLSPGWRPTSERELAGAASAGLLEESHHLDVKRELAPGKGANRELARDLASFAVDGGVIVIGVDETANPPALVPSPLNGLPERVEQVALTVVDEPLVVRSTPVPSDKDPSRGYLVVTIPPSPLAPHMVDGRYFGRGHRTKHVLSDGEVFRLHERRRSWEEAAEGLLDQYVLRDPFQTGKHAHLFIVANPTAARDGMLLPRIEGSGQFERSLLELVNSRALGQAAVGRVFAPDIGDAIFAARRADGWALTSHDFQQGREVKPEADEGSLLEVELSERGAIRLFCGRGTDTDHNGARVIFEELVVGLCHRVLAVAKTVAEETGYWAGWDLGVALNGLKGAASWLRIQGLARSAPAFPDESYMETTRASFEELDRRPNAVAERLLGRLVRALGTRLSQPMRSLLDQDG